MAYLTTINGVVLDSDDMTLGELGDVEKETGVPWSTLNPWRDAGVARAFLRVALARQGLSPEAVEGRLDSLTGREMKRAFTFRADEPVTVEGEEDEGEELPLDPSTPSSSPGAPSATAGGRAKQGRSGSGTSSS